MVRPRILQLGNVYTAPAWGEIVEDHNGAGGPGDIDIPPGKRYFIAEVRAMPQTKHTLRMGDKLKHSVTSWSQSGASVSVFKTAPRGASYAFGRHGYGNRSNMRLIGYLHRKDYQTLHGLLPQTDREGNRPGHSSSRRVDMYTIGKYGWPRQNDYNDVVNETPDDWGYPNLYILIVV